MGREQHAPRVFAVALTAGKPKRGSSHCPQPCGYKRSIEVKQEKESNVNLWMDEQGAESKQTS